MAQRRCSTIRISYLASNFSCESAFFAARASAFLLMRRDAADDFIGSLSSKVTNKISSYINSIERKTPSTISGAFVDEIQRRIDVLKQQVNNSKQTIDRLERLASKAEEVSL